MQPTVRPLLLAVFLSACAHHAPDLLQRYAQASGGDAWARIHAVRSTGDVSVAGLTGTITTIEDTDTGRFRTDLDLGAVTMSEGNDGAAAWERAPGGEVAVLDDPQTKRDAVTERWLGQHDYHDAFVTSLGAGHIRAVPPGGTPIELWFDAASGLLSKSVQQQGTNTVTTTYADYRAVDGVQMPFQVVVDSGDPRNLVTMTYKTIEVVDPPGDDAFARPKTDAERLTFAGDAQTADVAFELINHHIYIDAKVDGQPVRMLVDTGGLNMLTPAAATRLGLDVSGKMAGSGVGKEKVDVGIAHGHSLEVGAVTLADPVFYVIDMGNLPDVEGEAFDGLVGYEIFQRLAVRIDYPGRTLTLMRPEAFTAPAGATAVPFELRERTPVVDGEVDGVKARFTIDTGARNSLTLTSPFVAANDLVKKYAPAFETVTGWGVGGSVTSSPVRFGEIKVGDAVVKDVAGDLFTGDSGAMADPDSSGNLGGGVLARFVVTFDYTAHVMYLEPAANPPPRDVYDRAGMFFLRDGDALKIVAITPGGAAEKAKLQVGDHVTAIDGVDVSTEHLAHWRELFTGKVGTKIKLTTDRGAVTLTLKELLP